MTQRVSARQLQNYSTLTRSASRVSTNALYYCTRVLATVQLPAGCAGRLRCYERYIFWNSRRFHACMLGHCDFLCLKTIPSPGTVLRFSGVCFPLHFPTSVIHAPIFHPCNSTLPRFPHRHCSNFPSRRTACGLSIARFLAYLPTAAELS